MATSTISSGNVVTNFQKSVFHEYVRGGRFGPHIGNTVNSIIQTTNDLKKHSIPLVAKLDGDGVTGSQSLVGNEENMNSYSMLFTPTYHRQGTLIDNEEREKSEFDLYQEARPLLGNWGMEHKRDMIIQALGGVEAGGTYYNMGGAKGATGSTAAAAGNMDTWNTNNTDRIRYGASTGNLTAGNHTTSLATIDTTNDKLNATLIENLVIQADNTDPLIRPVMVKGDDPWYVFYVGSYAFRDLRLDLADDWQNAMPRSLDNPLFSPGDIVYNGVIVKKVPEIDSVFIDGTGTGQFQGVWGANANSADGLDDGGNLGSRVSVGFFCGAQAACFGIGRAAQYHLRKEDDYGHQSGVGIAMKHDIKKIFFNNKQHGMITSFHSSTA